MRARFITFVLLTLFQTVMAFALETAQRGARRVDQETQAEQEKVSDAPGAESPDQPVEQVFSGPQVGEKLPPLPVRGVFDQEAGKELDLVSAAEGKPVVLIFIHELNRPNAGMARALGSYAHSRHKDGLTTGIVWLDDDVTEAENTLKRIRHALPKDVPVGISMDGKEGPGSYGLNRNIALTILVGNKGVVTDNFALVQPSLQADLPKIAAAIVRQVGGEVPPLSELIGRPEMMRGATRDADNSELRDLLRPVIRRGATEAAVDRAVARVESYLRNNNAARAEVGRISRTIVDSGNLSNYGTPRAQEHLRRWAEKYGSRPRGADGSTSETTDDADPAPEAPSR